jgi:putative transposase
MQRIIEFSEGEYYHIYNRGVDKRNIFLDSGDHDRFVKLLYLSNGTKPFVFRDVQDKDLKDIERNDLLVAVGAYCLMPNHFHLLVKEIHEGGITQFMEKLGTAYSMYFNKRSKRTGFLFESNFKAQHVDNDEYLKYLFAYIHLNPVKLIEPSWKDFGIRDIGKAKKYLEDYQYSSYADHLGIKRKEDLILSRKEFPEYFEKTHEFKSFIDDWLKYKDDPEIIQNFT